MKIILFMLALQMMAFAQSGTKVMDYDVQQLKDSKNSKNFTFKVEENWVTRFLQNGGKRKNVTGLLKTPDHIKVKQEDILEIKVDRQELPTAFDWREEIGGLQPIRNQQNCGSCWSFSITGVIESLLMIKGKEMNPDLAEQTMVSTCSSHGTCRGGYFEAFNYTTSRGLVDEQYDPYRARNTWCRSLKGVERKRTVSWKYIRNNGGSPTTEQIKQAILDYGPVAVDVSGTFSSYKSGIYNNCNNAQTDHMVMLVGWNDEGGYWILRNSWGTGWGENGYMNIRYTDNSGRKCNGVGTRVAVGVIED